MKKLLVIMMAFFMSFSLAACSSNSDDAGNLSDSGSDEQIELAEVSANGLIMALPSDITYAQTNETYGSMLFANDESTAVVTVSVLTPDAITINDMTDEALLAALSAGSGLSNGSLERSVTLEHDGGTSIVGFGKGTLPNGIDLHSVIQYFFATEGGYHAISYLYMVDAESSLEEVIEQVVASLKAAE